MKKGQKRDLVLKSKQKEKGRSVICDNGDKKFLISGQELRPLPINILFKLAQKRIDMAMLKIITLNGLNHVGPNCKVTRVSRTIIRMTIKKKF